ncbi:MAG: Fpg/Nei family DNA glycosylase [Polyangiaceae bacterium]
MPELPDVEFARRRLQRWLIDARVSAAHCADGRLTRPTAPRLFERTLAGRRVVAVSRRGKWLRIELDDGERVFSHLGMTGEWVRLRVDAPALRFERARIDVTKGGRVSSVRYVDSRRFGRLVPAKTDIIDWTTLGPDPLSDGIDVLHLAAMMKGRRSVKEVLMDQRVLAGVGNIIATEALWIARIDPRAKANVLGPADVRAVATAVRKAILSELKDRAAGGDYEAGSFFVYGKAGQSCPRCTTPLASVVLGGRTSVYCPGCQGHRGSS